MIGKQGKNIKSVEEQICKLLEIDNVRIILRPQKEGAVITLKQIEDTIDLLNKKETNEVESL